MKKIILVIIGILLFTSCGPKRLGCGPKRLCDASEKAECIASESQKHTVKI